MSVLKQVHRPAAPRRSILLLGTSYRTSPISFREKLAEFLSSGRGRARVNSLPGVEESVVLVTCNRIELYLVAERPQAVSAEFLRLIRDVLGKLGGSPFYTYDGVDAVEHLFRVASGLDSIVLGEPQILSQVREAATSAKVSGNARGLLSPTFDRAYRVGKRVRSAYSVEGGEASLSSLAAKLALSRTRSASTRVLLIGTGKMVQLAASDFNRFSSRVFVASRRRSLPHKIRKVKLVGYTSIPEIARKCDVILSATKHNGFVLGPAHLKGKRRKLVIDLGMPRNVDPRVRDLPNVRLYDLDDLAKWKSDSNPEKRDVANARRLISREAAEFERWLVETRLSRTLAELYEWAARIRDEEVDRARRRISKMTNRDSRIIEALGRRVVSKILAKPTHFVRSLGNGLDQSERLKVLDEVFGLEKGD